KDQYGNPVSGMTVTFAAPASGASASFPSGATVTTGLNGQASAAVTANTVAGNYSVTATATGASTPASFSLSNLAQTTGLNISVTSTSSSATVASTFSSPLLA